ncbi:enoyl-CoA hydratase/isomerase family protein [Enterovirga rhinocerotis]|nr:enoyl-CoA hydratase-related protein [Enterovirga rhinocerotis]
MDPEAARDTQPALLAIDGPVATITLNRPGVLNAIDVAMAAALERLALQIEERADIRVLVIRGSGTGFCAGGDVSHFTAEPEQLEAFIRELLGHYGAFLQTLRRMPQLVLTSVHGAAAGAGFSLAFMGDMTIAADTTRFTPAYHKLGVSPDGGGTIGLVEALGPRRALHVFLAQGSFDAAQAAAYGLATAVVPADDLSDRTMDLARRLAMNSRETIEHTKRLVHRSAHAAMADQLDAERDALLACMRSDTFRTAVKRFRASS